jgi:hypothetical protein
MPRGSSPIKVQQWTERLERFAQSGQTVVQFCQEERVSQPSFYQWKKRLADQVRPTPANAESSRSAFRAVEVTSPSLSATTIRLANGIEIDLCGDLRVVQAVVKQVLELPVGATLAAGVRSC